MNTTWVATTFALLLFGFFWFCVYVIEVWGQWDQKEKKKSFISLGGHVRGHINLLGELGDLDLEAGLDRLENLSVLLVSNKGNGETLGTETTGTTDTMEVGIGSIGGTS